MDTSTMVIEAASRNGNENENVLNKDNEDNSINAKCKLQTVPGEFVALNQFEQLSKFWSDNRELMTQCCPLYTTLGAIVKTRNSSEHVEWNSKMTRKTCVARPWGWKKKQWQGATGICNKKQMFTLWFWLPLTLSLYLLICKWALGLWMNSLPPSLDLTFDFSIFNSRSRYRFL